MNYEFPDLIRITTQYHYTPIACQLM